MKPIGILKAIMLTSSYKKKSTAEKDALRETRLQQLVSYTKANSPYFQKIYSDIGDKFTLSDLPVTNKVDMMTHFDQWITDQSVHLSDLMKFMENLDNIGRSFRDQYHVYTTSGSTGNPAVVLYDKTGQNIMAAVALLRSYARREDMIAFIKRGGKSAGVYATGGFYLGNSTIRNRQLQNPRKKNQVTIVSILDPLPEIVAELNRFQPAMLGGYPTALALLAEEQKRGNLHIDPVIVMAGGEYLSDEVKALLQEAFGCYVQSGYSCTEAGMIACECRHGHYHLNEDWVLMEPVDADNKPVPNGARADKWLLTNLSNFLQPFIRYEITDRIIFHDEGCPCGNPAPWVEVEGRTDDILRFEGEQGDIRIVPLALYALLKEIHEIQRFQLILRSGNQVELRIQAEDKMASFAKAQSVLTNYLTKSGVQAEIYLSEALPQPHPKSGKFKHVYMEKAE